MATKLLIKEILLKTNTSALSTLSRPYFHQWCKLSHSSWACSRQSLCHQMKERVRSQALYGQPIRMAGHSKWANRRHLKAAKDAEKGKTASAILKKLRAAVQGLLVKFKEKKPLLVCALDCEEHLWLIVAMCNSLKRNKVELC